MAKIPLTENRWARYVAYVVLGVLALWLLSWLLVPPILKSQAQKIASEQLGRAVTIGKVDFRPWSLELTVNDIDIAGPSGATVPTLHVSKAYVNAEAQSVFRLAPVVDAVTIDGMQVNVAHLGDGRYDFDDVLARLEQNRTPSDPAKGPAKFALYNLSLTNASVNYKDAPLARTHELRDLNLTVPFLSSFDGQRDVNVEPRLAFVLNGSRFDSAATSTPFAQTRKTDATITLSGLDLEPYLGYIPASVPVKVQGAVIDAEIRLGFEQTPQTSVKLSGQVKVSRLRVADVSAHELFSLDELKVALADVRPLERIAKLGAIEVNAPSLVARRAADGAINLAFGGKGGNGGGRDGGAAAAATALSGSVAAASSASAAPQASDSSAASAPAAVAASAGGNAGASAGASTGTSGTWKIEVASVALRDGKVAWRDEATGAGPASVVLGNLVVDASDIVVPFDKPLRFKAAANVAAQGVMAAASAPTPARAASGAAPRAASAGASAASAAAVPGSTGRLVAEGTATDKAAHADVKVDDLSLTLAAPYVAAFLEPELGGRLSADVGVDWQAAGALKVAAKTLTLDRLALVSSLADDQRAGRRAGPGQGEVQAQGQGQGQGQRQGQSRRSGQGQARDQGNARGQAARNVIEADDAPGKTTVAQIRQIVVTDADIDVAASKAAIGSVTITDPRTGVTRAADKHWMYERWMQRPTGVGGVSTAPAGGDTARPAGAASKGSSPPWSVSLGELALDGGAVSFVDNGTGSARPISFITNDLKVRLGKFALGAAPPSPLELSARVGSGRTEFGTLDFKGTVGIDPVSAQGAINVARFPVHALQPYIGDLLNVQLARADTSFKGNVNFASATGGPKARLTGDVAVDNFRVNTIPLRTPASVSGAASAASAASASNDEAPGRQSGSVASALSRRAPVIDGEELLSWKSLGLRGLDVSLAPGTATTVDVKETVVTDLYARLILNENARLNLQDVMKAPEAPASSPASSARVSASSPRAAASSAASSSSGMPVVRFGPVNLVNAKVLFSDHFVQPNYSANLSELTGTLSAFTSVPASEGVPQLANLELRGRAENTASLDITGKLNPLAKPLALDIAAKVRDLELPPLTPYSVKYSGYGIQRGKMSVDVHYTVQPDGQLTAQNKVVLNQLTFGDKVEGSTASLPVKLAVALLADRNGVIDVDIPLSGSLNDPQFSLGSIIGKAVLNLLVKAITAPFSLLANVFGGSGGGADQLSAIEFRPGSVLLGDDAKAALDKVAKALIDRPALKMTVVGTSSIDAEREPYRRERLNQLLQAEKRKAGGSRAIAATAQAAASSASSAGAGALPPPIPITPEEYPKLIKAVYDSADIAKPRNAIGFARDLETPQMEALLLNNISATDEAIRELAVERGVAVRDYLSSRQVSLDRLFLGAVKAAKGVPAATAVSVDAGGNSASALAAAGAASSPAGATAAAAAAIASAASGAGAGRTWTPSAELTLSPR